MHPDRDCELCGVQHTPWSEHARYQAWNEHHWPDVLLLVASLQDLLAGADPHVAYEAVQHLALRLDNPDWPTSTEEGAA